MKDQKIRTGRCLCGKVTVKLELEDRTFDACHCGMCRRWAGGPGMGVHANKGLEIKGEEYISVYESSDWAQRGFCKQCGTHLFYKLKDGSFCNLPMGLLDDTSDLEFGVQIFVDSKPANYAFANRTKMMTEAEVLAAFGKAPT